MGLGLGLGLALGFWVRVSSVSRHALAKLHGLGLGLELRNPSMELESQEFG